MAVGMSFSGVCCFVAWLVERERLSRVRFLSDQDEGIISLSIMVLTPQFLLLGLMKGFAEGGLEIFLCDRVKSESMKNIVEPCIEMVLGIGKLSSILFAFIFRSWIKDKMNDSHLDRYYLVLASLSFMFLGIYVCYAKFKLQKPQCVEPERVDELEAVQVDAGGPVISSAV
ncbi:protein NRT1/ PTR FAMILY 5.10-like [Prosopis cineraria]|uniref:protein NRT1/ PTR FAMILY 5.10-like n=1 Tax=Prosopis cineraria TaxID=364024 RepID=UPI00240FEE93|nr:protein NRT1/ PTR FAMILY 5.10-like [Prosopis cineraria]